MKIGLKQKKVSHNIQVVGGYIFNNAGIANFAGAFEDIKIEEMNKIIDVNFKGVVNGCFTMLEILRSTKTACYLIQVQLRDLLQPRYIVYGATKHAVSSLPKICVLSLSGMALKYLKLTLGLPKHQS